MAIPRNIKQYLFHNGVSYSRKKHSVAYTSQEVAQAEHIPGAEFAKTVVLQADDRMIFAVLPVCRCAARKARFWLTISCTPRARSTITLSSSLLNGF